MHDIELNFSPSIPISPSDIFDDQPTSGEVIAANAVDGNYGPIYKNLEFCRYAVSLGNNIPDFLSRGLNTWKRLVENEKHSRLAV